MYVKIVRSKHVAYDVLFGKLLRWELFKFVRSLNLFARLSLVCEVILSKERLLILSCPNGWWKWRLLLGMGRRPIFISRRY